jgi:hypothetical protein
MNKNWIYFGVFLDLKSKNKLLELTNKVADQSWKRYCHHMTIAFNNGSELSKHLYNIYKEYFGTEVNITATHIGISDEAIAVKVYFKGNTANKIAHVTLATPQGGKPVKSNYIENWRRLKTPIDLTGTIEEFIKN